MRRLMTLPGISGVAACTLVAAIGKIDRFQTSGQLVSYFGLNPKVRQSGSEKPRHGRISKQGPGEVRHVLVEAAWHAMRTPGPLRIFAERIAAKRGVNVAVARKMVVIAWHMLTKQEDYAFTRPSLVREKIRRLELLTGTGPKRGEKGATPTYATDSNATSSSTSPAKPNAPTPVSSKTGNQPYEKVRAPHRGAHREVSRSDKQRGRTQPHVLRLSSRSPAPPQRSQTRRRPASP